MSLKTASCATAPVAWGSDCIERAVHWKEESWLMCDGLGWYMSGFRRGLGTRGYLAGLDWIDTILCCKPRAPPAGVPDLAPGMRIRLKAPAGAWLRHRNSELHCDPSDWSVAFNADATFKVTAALSGHPRAISLVSENFPGHYLRH